MGGKNIEKNSGTYHPEKRDTNKNGADSHPKHNNQRVHEQYSKDGNTRKQNDRKGEYRVDLEKVANTAKKGIKELMTSLKRGNNKPDDQTQQGTKQIEEGPYNQM